MDRDAPAGEGRIHDVVLLTRDRPVVLPRSLERTVRHAGELGRPLRFHVFDDAVEAAGLEQNAAAIERVQARTGVEIAHVTREDRARWIQTLTQMAGGTVDGEVVRGGLLGPAGGGVVTGANHNSIALSMVDRSICCSDDDVSPPLAHMLGHRAGLVLRDEGDPTELYVYRTRAEAIGAVAPANVNMLVAHESMLGLDEALGSSKSAQPVSPAPRARVVFTMLGCAGDAGMGSSAYFAFLTGAPRARWAGDFENLCESREVVRGAPMATISRAGFLMMMHVGMDLGAFLPPHAPSGRNQEAPVAFALRHISPDYCIGHPPYVIVHQPPESRSSTLEQAVDAVKHPQASHLLMMCISALPRQHLDPATATVRLGEFLVQCTDDPTSFQRLIRQKAVQFQEVRMARLEDALASRSNEPQAWADHLRRLLSAAEHAARDPHYPLALDMAGDRTQRQAALRAYVRQYGRLLVAWPTLRDVAREARRQGKGLPFRQH